LPLLLSHRRWLAVLLANWQAGLEQWRWRSAVRGSGTKNLLQQRHLRRVCGRLIVSQTSKQRSQEENEKEEPEEDEAGRRKKSVRGKRGKKNQRKKTEFQTGGFPPLSFRR
jgi:hypothetical protein